MVNIAHTPKLKFTFCWHYFMYLLRSDYPHGPWIRQPPLTRGREGTAEAAPASTPALIPIPFSRPPFIRSRRNHSVSTPKGRGLSSFLHPPAGRTHRAPRQNSRQVAGSTERSPSKVATWQILQRSGAIVLQAQRTKHIQSRNLALAIWQPSDPVSDPWLPDGYSQIIRL